jgi:hypothetical protein
MSTHLYDINSLLCIGLSEKEATEKLQADGWTVRTILRDGKPLPGTDDIRGDRCNLEIQDGKVFEISIG